MSNKNKKERPMFAEVSIGGRLEEKATMTAGARRRYEYIKLT